MFDRDQGDNAELYFDLVDSVFRLNIEDLAPIFGIIEDLSCFQEGVLPLLEILMAIEHVDDMKRQGVVFGRMRLGIGV
jgi:hypothetical protein